MSCGLKGENAGEGGLHEHAAGEVFELAVERELELLDERGVVPGGVKALEVVEELADGHPVGELLVFAGVADAGEVRAGEVGGVFAEDGGGAGGRVNHVHQELDERGFAGAVVADERENGAAGHGEGERMEGLGARDSLWPGRGSGSLGSVLAEVMVRLGSKEVRTSRG